MRHSLFILMLAVVACQQPATSPTFSDSDISFKKNDIPAGQSGSGVVTWTNKKGNAGKITSASGLVYQYNVNAGHTLNGFVPKTGDQVLFTSGNGMVAYQVRLGTLVDDGGGDGDGGDGDGGDGDGDGDGGSDDPVCLPGQYLSNGVCYWIPS